VLSHEIPQRQQRRVIARAQPEAIQNTINDILFISGLLRCATNDGAFCAFSFRVFRPPFVLYPFVPFVKEYSFFSYIFAEISINNEKHTTIL
jgi:hypothetical protein